MSFVLVIRLLLDGDTVTTATDAESVAERIFEPAFAAEEVVAGSWDIEDDDA